MVLRISNKNLIDTSRAKTIKPENFTIINSIKIFLYYFITSIYSFREFKIT